MHRIFFIHLRYTKSARFIFNSVFLLLFNAARGQRGEGEGKEFKGKKKLIVHSLVSLKLNYTIKALWLLFTVLKRNKKKREKRKLHRKKICS